MFWKRKSEIIEGRLGLLSVPPCPAKPEYGLLKTMLIDAENISIKGTSEVEVLYLKNMIAQIEIMIKNKTQSCAI